MAAQPQEGVTRPGAACAARMPQARRPQRPPPKAAPLQPQGQRGPSGSVRCPHTEARREGPRAVCWVGARGASPFKAQGPPFPPGPRAAPLGTNPFQSTEGFRQGASPSPAGRHPGDREGPSPVPLLSTCFSPRSARSPPCRPQWERAAHHLTTSCLRCSLRPQSRKWGARGGRGQRLCKALHLG